MIFNRPTTLVGFTALIATYLFYTMPKNVLITSLALFSVFIFIHKVTKNKYTKSLLIILITSVISIVFSNMYTDNLINKISELPVNNQCTITGVVEDINNSYAIPRYTLNLDTVNHSKIKNVKLYAYISENIEVGEELKITGKIKIFDNKYNLNNYYSRNIVGSITVDNIEYIGFENSLNSIGYSIRQKLLKSASNLYTSNARPIVYSMGYSDKSLLDEETKNMFAVAGISHALVVSGLHIGIIYLVLNILFKYIPINKKIKNILLAFILLLIMCVIGFTPSIIRACTVVIFTLIAKNYLVTLDTLSVLGIILIWTLINNPYSATNIGLLLSYSASVGVILALNICKYKKYSKIKTNLIVTTFATLFTIPVLSLANMQVTLLSPFSNLLLVIFITPICILSFITPIFSYLGIIGNMLNAILVPINNILINLFTNILSGISDIFSFALLNIGTDFFKFLIFGTLIITFIAFIQINNEKIKKLVILGTVFLLVICYNEYNKNNIFITAFDSGYQSSFIVQHNNVNSLILAEVPTDKTINNIIRSNNISSIDTIILCSKKYDGYETLEQYSDNVIVLNKKYESDVFNINSEESKRGKIFYINILDTTICFSYNKVYMTDNIVDFYFFGSDTPGEIYADNIYYFTPVLKKNIEIIDELHAIPLYNDLKIKINIKNKQYDIVKDVQNFG